MNCCFWFVILGLGSSGCAVEGPPEGAQRAATRHVSEVTAVDLRCYRRTAPMPGVDVQDFRDECANAGGALVCSDDAPRCCVTLDGARHCFSDISEVSRVAWQRVTLEPEVVPTLDLSIGPELTID